MTAHASRQALATGGALAFLLLTPLVASFVACNAQSVDNGPEGTAQISQALSANDGGSDAEAGASFNPGSLVSAPLRLQVLTNSCGENQMQDFFEVTNTGYTPVNLSDISIKFWAYDTSGEAVDPHVWTGGCVVGVNGNPSCVHQVEGVTPTATQFSPACGPTPTEQANWEITITNTDGTQLPPGATWSNIQSALNLANYSNFSPGTADWYSPCLSGHSYQTSSQFAVYYQGNLVFANGVAAPDCRAPHGTQQLSGYVQPSVALVGPAPQSSPLTLAISLPVRTPSNAPTLATFAQQASDPKSPLYRHFLSADLYAVLYSPTSTDYTTLTTFVTSNGLTILNSYADRELLEVSGTVGQVEQMLLVNFNYYLRADGTQFLGPDREPSLRLSLPILHIAGTDNFVLPQANSGPSGPGGTLFGNDFRTAYLSSCGSGAPSLDGRGQFIALIETEGFNQADISAYDAKAGIPDITPIQITYTTNFPGVPPVTGNGSAEAPADIELAHAMAPGAGIVVYQSPIAAVTVAGFTFTNFYDKMLHDVAHPSNGVPRSNQVSISLAIPGDGSIAQSVNAMASLGQSVFNSSGDNGASTGNPLDLRTFDNVTVVGGTNLVSFGGGASPVEAVWDTPSAVPPGAGGGGFFGPWFLFDIVSPNSGGSRPAPDPIPGQSLPTYQQGFVNQTNLASSLYRNFPDVSMVAQNVAVFVTTANGTHGSLPANGTSASTPLWAAVMALANQKGQASGLPPVGFANPTLYAISNPAESLYASCFNDIRMGSNPTTPNVPGIVVNDPDSGPPVNGFPAVQGYDLATGLGSPTCTLVAQLGAPTPTSPVSTVPPIIDVVAGDLHSCALFSDGTVQCWGDNTRGALGDNGSESNASTAVSATISGVTALSANGVETCAIVQGGSVDCWGGDQFGQLGTNSPVSSCALSNGTACALLPVPVAGITSAISLSVGASFACAVLSSGTVECWGDNTFGELGNGTIGGTSATPVPVMNLANATAVTAGGDHTCALLSDGTVECWGGNYDGQLGNGTTDSSAIPAIVAGIAGAVGISAGADNTCARLVGGTVACWGADDGGQLAIAAGGTNSCMDPPCSLSPTAAAFGSLVGAISAAGPYTCSVSGQVVSCAGDNNVGQLGTGTTTGTSSPGIVVGLVSGMVTAFDAGFGHACAVINGATIMCWGDDEEGDLGNGSCPGGGPHCPASSTPVLVQLQRTL